MKNIHLIPTDKPSRLFIHNAFNDLRLDDKNVLHDNNQHIYITSDEFIEEDNFGLNISTKEIVKYNGVKGLNSYYKKIILTTDLDLINDGVQAIDDEFLEWFVKNPSCEWVEVENSGPGFPAGIYFINYLPEHFVQETTIPKEEPKQETVEEAAYQRAVDRNWNPNSLETRRVGNEIIEAVKFGAKWQQERMYSEEDMIEFSKWRVIYEDANPSNVKHSKKLLQMWFEQFKKK